MEEIRTHADIVQDLVDRIEVWRERYIPCGRGCCGKWETSCEGCDEEEGDYCDAQNYRKHKPDCKLVKLIAEAEAFIEVERELENG